MNHKIIQKNNVSCAVISSDEILISNVDSALDFIATVKYETNCDRIAIEKSAIIEDFFILSTRLAGEILQKFVQYRVKIAIIGDFSVYTSKPMRDFIYESNQGSHVFFADSEDMAVELLTKAK